MCKSTKKDAFLLSPLQSVLALETAMRFECPNHLQERGNLSRYFIAGIPDGPVRRLWGKGEPSPLC